ncbi:MAG: protein-(glutamine-N5) methyltransferase, release factor-specific [Chloroflexi bacterium]|nr:protein-(glutamine-N5) methyltransferase, release factor-specific [Chloroflexota bacterium]|tara:strand:- start:1196 stop:2008 length:813 start_codon:yes stop_codon:yes gene_type:complete
MNQIAIPDSDLESDLLVSFALKMSRTELHTNIGANISISQQEQIQQLVNRRIAHEPLAYILGFREFFGNSFIVNDSVLIPRQETECLVEIIIEYLNNKSIKNPTVLDVGCGSGIIGASILQNIPNINLVSIDISTNAAKIAYENIESITKDRNFNVCIGDLVKAIKGPIDLIAANLPYIPTERIPKLQKEIVLYEPKTALDGGIQGIEVITRLINQSTRILKPSGAIFLEIDPEQTHIIGNELHYLYPKHTINIVQDLSGKERILSVTKL